MTSANSKHLELGKKAEDLATEHVEQLGWRILSRNFSCRLGELDIVAMDEVGKELIVVEVRYRTLGDVQSPEDSIGPKKLRTLVNAGRVYVDDIGWTGPWRVDLIGITAHSREPSNQWKLEHIENITDGVFKA